MFKLRIRREFVKPVNSTRTRVQVKYIVERALSGARGRTWKCVIKKVKTTSELVHCFGLTFRREGRKISEESLLKQQRAIVSVVEKTATLQKYQPNSWIVLNSGTPSPILVKPKSFNLRKYTGLNFDTGNFEHIYKREAQINVVLSALQAAIDTKFDNRFHCCLHGEPACGKTSILLAMADMLGKEGEDYIKFDATSSTEAGVSKILLDAAHIPPVMIIEEIEKANEKSLRWLLGVLDQRGEIRRTNYRIGNQVKTVNMLCFATVNDIKLFRSIMSGALSSRFSHMIHCPLPNKKIIAKILRREVESCGGNLKWIRPTIEYCVDKRGWNDPRKIIPVCLCGGDDLLTGVYQEYLDAVSPDEVVAKPERVRV